MDDDRDMTMKYCMAIIGSLAFVAWNLTMGSIIQHEVDDNQLLVFWVVILLSVIIGTAISTVLQEGHPFESLSTTFGITLGTEAELITIAAIGCSKVKEVAKATADTAKVITITISPDVLWCIGTTLVALAIAGVFIFLIKHDY